MRPDMAKVVTEAPRLGHGARNFKSRAKVAVDPLNGEGANEDGKGADGDFGPRRFKMSRHAPSGLGGDGDGKSFSDLLGPLRKYLAKQVGRPWDAVYSELAATLDKRSISGLHIWDHVWEFVERHVVEGIDGRIVCKRGTGGWRWYYPNEPRYFFVHPRTGLLSVQAPAPKVERPVDRDAVKLDKFTELRRLDGIWYHIRYGVKDVYIPPVRYQSGAVIRPESWREEFVQIGKKQLSRAELKAYGIANKRAALSISKSRRSFRTSARVRIVLSAGGCGSINR